ncbi:glycosyltransferase family 39 protein [Bacteroidota bacterium]
MSKQITRQFFLSDVAIISYFAIIKILFHLLHPEYGYLRDELYYIAISDDYSFSNLDMLPLSPLYLKLVTYLLGYSLKAIHFASALCGALSIILACLITRELGGKKHAIFITGLSVSFSGFLIFGSLFTYDSIDFLIWTSALFVLVKIFKENNPRLFILVGVLLGLGLLNKLTIIFFGLTIFVSLWFVPQRVYYKSKWIWIAGLISVFFALPFLLWQYFNDWYYIDFAQSYAGGVSYLASFPEYLWNQILPNNIFNLPIWITGLILLIFSSKWKQYRFFGISFIFLFLLFYFLAAKFYFLIPFYAVLLSVGSIKIEEYINKFGADRPKVKFIKIFSPVIYVILSLPITLLAVPILPVEQFVEYAKIFGTDAGVKYENQQINQLPQHFADRFGWEEMVQEIANVANEIHSEKKDRVGIITGNWGQAGAVHFYRKNYSLPEPISTDGWFYYQTLRTNDIKGIYISIGVSRGELDNIFKHVEKEGFYTHSYCMPNENNKPIYVCSEPKFSLMNYWKVVKSIDSQFLEIMQKNSVNEAINFYHDTVKKDSSAVLFTELQVNNLGYEYLRKGEVEDAIKLFKLNVDVYPLSANVYDSLGEAYKENGDYELSLNYYRKALEINPNFENSK